MSSDWTELYTKAQRDDALEQLERRVIAKEIDKLLIRIRSTVAKMDETWDARISVIGVLNKMNKDLEAFETKFSGEYKARRDKRFKEARQRIGPLRGFDDARR